MSIWTTLVLTGQVQETLPPARWFNIACMHRRTVENWSRVFGEESIQLQVYERHSNSIDRLRQICQVPKGIGNQPQITHNQRLGHKTVLQLAELNRTTNKFDHRGEVNPA